MTQVARGGSGPRGYYYLSLQETFHGQAEPGGHGVAFYLDPDGECRLFDANNGEYQARTAEELLRQLAVLVQGYRIQNLAQSWTHWDFEAPA